MEYLVGDDLLSVAPKTNVPYAILNCIGYLARLVRGAIETNFWEFGAPPYPKHAIETRPDLPESIGGHRKIATHELVVDSHLHRAPYPLKPRLHQYGTNGTRGTAL